MLHRNLEHHVTDSNRGQYWKVIFFLLSCRNYTTCSTQPKSGLLASLATWVKFPMKTLPAPTQKFEVCGFSFASGAHGSIFTPCQGCLYLWFSVSLVGGHGFWGRWRKAGFWNGLELSRTISKPGTISNLARTISIFLKKWLEPYYFFWKNGKIFSIFLTNGNTFHFFPKTTPELSFRTAFHFLSILPCPHIARWAKKGEDTGGWQNWNETFEGETWQLH